MFEYKYDFTSPANLQILLDQLGFDDWEIIKIHFGNSSNGQEVVRVVSRRARPHESANYQAG